MARKISLKLSGRAEKFLIEMEAEGLNEADVISKALSILETVWKTNRVALISEPLPTAVASAKENIEYYFQVVSKNDNKEEGMRSETSAGTNIPAPRDANDASTDNDLKL